MAHGACDVMPISCILFGNTQLQWRSDSGSLHVMVDSRRCKYCYYSPLRSYDRADAYMPGVQHYCHRSAQHGQSARWVGCVSHMQSALTAGQSTHLCGEHNTTTIAIHPGILKKMR
jgi:hypothetical protein